MSGITGSKSGNFESPSLDLVLNLLHLHCKAFYLQLDCAGCLKSPAFRHLSEPLFTDITFSPSLYLLPAEIYSLWYDQRNERRNPYNVNVAELKTHLQQCSQLFVQIPIFFFYSFQEYWLEMLHAYTDSLKMAAKYTFLNPTNLRKETDIWHWIEINFWFVVFLIFISSHCCHILHN